MTHPPTSSQIRPKFGRGNECISVESLVKADVTARSSNDQCDRSRNLKQGGAKVQRQSSDGGVIQCSGREQENETVS